VKYTGLAPSINHGNDAEKIPNPFQGPNPSSVDWRDYLVGVKDQKRCGSCWSFSAACSLEFGYNFAIKNNTNDNESFSEQQMIDCSGSFGNKGCSGGLMDKAFNYVLQNGLETETDYSYKHRD